MDFFLKISKHIPFLISLSALILFWIFVFKYWKKGDEPEDPPYKEMSWKEAA